MNVGMKQINVGAWNTIAGLDFYSRIILSNIIDMSTSNHPYTGEVIPLWTPWIDIQTKGRCCVLLLCTCSYKRVAQELSSEERGFSISLTEVRSTLP
jgi:hypothetical protein